MVHSCRSSHRELCQSCCKGCRVSPESQSLGRGILKTKRAVALMSGTLVPCPQDGDGASPQLGRGSRWQGVRQQTVPCHPPARAGIDSSVSHQPFNPMPKTEKQDHSLNNKEKAGDCVDLALSAPLKIKNKGSVQKLEELARELKLK